MSEIGILGAGIAGRQIGRFLLRGGNRILISNSRGPDSLTGVVADLWDGAAAATAAEAKRCDVVVLALPWSEVESVLDGIDWMGRIVVDATNAIRRFDPPLIESFDFDGRTSSEVVRDLARGARVVKAFSMRIYPIPLEPGVRGELWAYFYCGDDAAANETVARL